MNKTLTRATGAFLSMAALTAAEPNQLPNQSLPAAQTPPKAPPKSAGLLNDHLRKENPALSKWDFGGQIRLRVEHRAHGAAPGSVDFQKNGNSGNTYVLDREKFHIGYTPTPWVGFFVQGRNSGSHNDDRNPNPEADLLDLHQAFVTIGDKNQFPLVAKVGRQELSYGDERLVGAFDWNNIGRVFDAAKIRSEGSFGWVDAFVGRVVIPDDNNFNAANDYDVFSGIYASTRKIFSKQDTEVYFLARNVGEGSPATIGAGLAPSLSGASPRDIYTLGTRFKSVPGAIGNWDYSVEMAAQYGNFEFAVGGPNLEHQAFAAHAGLGHTFKKSPWAPRLGVEYNFATGDSDPTDDKHETFENLFPTNHKFYGYMDFASWQNIHNPRINIAVKPTAKLTVTADYHMFWLADTSDFFYMVNGAPRNGGGYTRNTGADNYVGSEIDIVATYAFTPYANAQVGYGHFFTGQYINDSLGANHTDADWIYAQVAFSF